MSRYTTNTPDFDGRREALDYDTALCQDPVLKRLVELTGDDALEHMMQAAKTALGNTAISAEIGEIMVEEVQLAASTNHLFPYHTDGVLMEAAEKYADLRHALGAFGTARAMWLSDMDDPDSTSEYMQAAAAVRSLQQEYELPVDGSDPLFMEDE